jgi:hypothetical protein
MTHLYASELKIEVREGNAKLTDPLVINLDGVAGKLSEETFRLDLDKDGSVEDVPWTAAGSGFLALDRDGDGTVKNASELFGPDSGDGFRELSAYDGDQNGWIDEADPIFAQLKIWQRDAGGERMTSLAEVGVGAIGLGNLSTEFSVKDAQNALLGQVRSTGIFVREDGRAGTVQHLDMVV